MELSIVINGSKLIEYQNELKKTYSTISSLSYNGKVLKIVADETLDEVTVRSILENFTPSSLFDPNDFDEWLMATYMGTELEQYFPVLSRATEKNNPRGYTQMLSFAQAKGITEEVQNSLIAKLTELGASING